MDAALGSALEASIRAATGSRFTLHTSKDASGGCIHRSLVLEGSGERYFAKINTARFADAFEAEADGLGALAAMGVRTPCVVAQGAEAGQAFLVLEYLELAGGNPGAYERLGSVLASMHAQTQSRFGWPRNNWIGASPQSNRSHARWLDFWREERLLPQLALARRNGYETLARSGERLAATLDSVLAGHEPPPSLVHGDLWSGNAAFLADGTPVLFDPAVYCGDAEADIAMMELFGGFPARLYAAYRAARPEQQGDARRRLLYNLYHVLNHANLFGGGYVRQAAKLIRELG